MLIKGDHIVVRVDAPTFFMKLIHIRNVEVVAARRIAA